MLVFNASAAVRASEQAVVAPAGKKGGARLSRESRARADIVAQLIVVDGFDNVGN